MTPSACSMTVRNRNAVRRRVVVAALALCGMGLPLSPSPAASQKRLIAGPRATWTLRRPFVECTAGDATPATDHGLAMAKRDLGRHRFDGTIDLIWTAKEVDRAGTWVGAYAIRGHLAAAAEGEEALLTGWSMRGDGVMSGTGERILCDAGSCCFELGTNHMLARFSAVPGRWARQTLRFSFFGGSGPYRTLCGEGTIERLMHLPHAAPVGWGFLRGAVAWCRE